MGCRFTRGWALDYPETVPSAHAVERDLVVEVASTGATIDLVVSSDSISEVHAFGTGGGFALLWRKLTASSRAVTYAAADAAGNVTAGPTDPAIDTHDSLSPFEREALREVMRD